MSDFISGALKILGLTLISIAGITFMIFFGLWFLAFLLFFVAIGVVAVLCGVPFKVTKNGEHIGYWQRGKFYSK